VKPEGLPDRYWDATTGLRSVEVASALSALEAENAKQTDAFKDFPEKPDDAGKFYQMPEQMLPEGVSLPEGTKFEPNQALLDKALPVLHKHKVSRDAFQDLVRQFNAYEVEQHEQLVNGEELPPSIQAALEVRVQRAFAEDNKKLGANGEQRRTALGAALSPIYGAEHVGPGKTIDPARLSSREVECFEAGIAKHSGQNNVFPLKPAGNDPPPAPDPNRPLIDRLAESMYGKQKVS
jgi:hypothetical protein